MTLLSQIASHGMPLDPEFENIYKWYNKYPLTQSTAVTTTATLKVTEAGLLLGDTSGGAVTSTLPAASGNVGLTYVFLLDTAGNDWTISDGATVATLSSANDCVVVRSEGDDWRIISQKLVKITNPDIDGGSIDNTVIGGTTPSAGAFTTISANTAGSSIACEAWHEVGADGEPAFENNWVNFNAPTNETAGFLKDPFGFVHLKGLVKSGTVGTVIFTLPAGYRPSLAKIVAASGSDVATRDNTVTLLVTGTVTANCATNTYFSLDGITFKV